MTENRSQKYFQMQKMRSHSIGLIKDTKECMNFCPLAYPVVDYLRQQNTRITGI